MSARKVIWTGFLVASTACLAIGLTEAGAWIAFGIALCLPLVWLLSDRLPILLSPNMAFLLQTGIAAVGMFLGASPAWMIVSAVLGLVGWDLFHLGRDLENAEASSSKALMRYTQIHFVILALVLGSSLLVIAIGRSLSVQISFGAAVIIVVAAAYSLKRLFEAASTVD